MAVLLAITYQKKLGLPNYSSHSCSVSLTVEIPDASVAAQECSKFYSLLQAAVDEEIKEVGWMPDATTYGMNNQPANGQQRQGNGNGSNGDGWNCTEGQRNFIQRIVNENKLDKNKVEEMAQDLFGIGVKALDKMQASNLIDELLGKSGKGRGQRRPQFQRKEAANER